MRDLQDRVTKEDLEKVFAEFGSVEYVQILSPSSDLSGRNAIISMAKVDGGTYDREHMGQGYKGTRLRLVKPRPRTDREDMERPVSKKKNLNAVKRFLKYFLGSWSTRKPVPERVRVVKR
jgi:hypothetical protein